MQENVLNVQLDFILTPTENVELFHQLAKISILLTIVAMDVIQALLLILHSIVLQVPLYLWIQDVLSLIMEYVQDAHLDFISTKIEYVELYQLPVATLTLIVKFV